MGKQRRGFSWRAVANGFLAGMLLALAAAFILRPTVQPRAINQADVVAEQALDKVLPEVSIERAPLADAANRISDLSGVRISLDLPAGVNPGDLVTVRLRNATLATVLDDLTEQVEGSKALTWNAERQAIRITTPVAALSTTLRSYDVGDLLRRVTPSAVMASLPPPPAPSSASASPAASSAPPPPPTPQGIAEITLETVVTRSIAADSWIGHGGKTGRLLFFGNEMVVVQTPRNHRRIRVLLSSLRSGASQELPAPPNTASMRWRQEAKQWARTDSAEVDALLSRRVPVLRIERQTAENALTTIGHTWGVATLLEQQYVAAKLHSSPLISFELHDATGHEALRTLLKAITNANEALPNPHLLPPLRWGIDRGLVVIVWRADLTDAMMLTRSYDVHGWFTGTGDELEQYLQKTVDPPSWLVFGHVRGSCQVINDTLVVTQTYENQERVATALRDLRQALREKRDPTTMPATRPAE